MADVDPNEVRAAVARITASAVFVNSDRLCRFLRFTVNSWLAGEGDQIKEYSIGREVFDRDGNYDPRTDPIVRVEARRLRKKLDEYYAGVGRDEPLKLYYPKGCYVPNLLQPETHAADRRNRRYWVLAVAATLAAGLAGWTSWCPAAIKPKVIVLPARWVWKTGEFTQTPFDVDLAERVAAQLANRHGTTVVPWPMAQTAAQNLGNANETAIRFGASRSLLIAVRVEATGTRVTAYLIDPKVDRKIHVTDKEERDLTSTEQREQVAITIADEVAKVLH